VTTAGSAGTAGRDYKIEPPTGRHRAPPPVPTPRAPTVIAVAAAVLTAASLTAIAGQAVAPDGRSSASQVSTVTRAERTTAGPLEIPTIGVVAPAIESLYPTTENALSRPRSVPGVQGHVPATKTTAAGLSEVSSSAQEPTVTPPPQPVSEDQPTPTTPLADPIAADSATPTSEEQPVDAPTESPVTVDVTGEVAVP